MDCYDPVSSPRMICRAYGHSEEKKKKELEKTSAMQNSDFEYTCQLKESRYWGSASGTTARIAGAWLVCKEEDIVGGM